jgi:hypothetical protein
MVTYFGGRIVQAADADNCITLYRKCNEKEAGENYGNETFHEHDN